MTIDLPKDYTIVVPSCRPYMQQETQQHLHRLGLNPILFDGTNYPSFAKLINTCILNCPTNNIIICNDKARPDTDHFMKMIDYHEEGYGFVALFAFGFFCLSKSLIKQIGWLDERFIGGGYEDCDFIRRLALHNIAFINLLETPYLEIGSAWRSTSKEFYEQKWKEIDHLVWLKKLNEEKYNYSIVCSDRVFLPFSRTIMDDISKSFVNVKIQLLKGVS